MADIILPGSDVEDPHGVVVAARRELPSSPGNPSPQYSLLHREDLWRVASEEEFPFPPRSCSIEEILPRGGYSKLHRLANPQL